jgi:hypothetical protein
MQELAKIEVEQKEFFIDKRKIKTETYYVDNALCCDDDDEPYETMSVKRINLHSKILLDAVDKYVVGWQNKSKNSKILLTTIDLLSLTSILKTMIPYIILYKKLYLLKKHGYMPDTPLEETGEYSNKDDWSIVFKLEEIWTLESVGD